MTNQVNQAFEKCDCLNFCGDDIRISKCKVEPCQDYKKHSAIVSAKRVYTSGYGSVETGEIDITSTKESDLKNGDFLYSKDSVIKMIEAATQASESEINSLKQRVEELQANNNQLRKALDMFAKDCTGEIIHSTNWLKQQGRKALSAIPAESLKAHDDELIEKCAKVCESIYKYTQFQTVEDYKLANEASRNIRALKEVNHG